MELQDWWEQVSKQDLADVLPKAAEYGSNSLEEVGRKIAKLRGVEVDKAQALELGCYIYAVGKMERWTDAVLKGQNPSVDTLKDLQMYCTMARRIRDGGDWPGDIGAGLVASAYHDPDCQGIGKPCCGGAALRRAGFGSDSRTL